MNIYLLTLKKNIWH